MDELEKQIIDVLNENQLPLEAKRYVVKHIFEVLNYELAVRTEQPKTEPQE